MRRRRDAAALACLVALAGCTAESGGGAAEVPAEPAEGGTCVVALFSDLDGLNEFVSTDGNATSVMEWMLYMPLLRWSGEIEIEARLARSWQSSEDGKVVTMQLRDDVRWHDGVPTTAEDVKFSFDRFLDPALGYPDQGSLLWLEAVEVLGPHEVRFRFSKAYADQLAHLRRLIMPKHLLERVPVAEMESAAFNRAPVGNGPFRFVRWRQQQEIVFEANPDFCDGRPKLDRVVFRIIPDQTAIETALRSGQVDVIERLRFDAVAPMRDNPRVQVHSYPARGYQFIGWNLRNPLFAEAEVRRAMTLAIDRQRILDALVFGEGRVTAHPIMSLSPFYAKDILPHPHDPEAAREILARHGWRDTDGDGWLDRDGKKFEFELLTNLGNQLREDTLVMIQDDLKKIGVSVVPRVREWAVFLGDVENKRFEAFHMGWQTDFVLKPYDVFHSDAIEGKYNAGSFANPRVDELIEAGGSCLTGEEAMPVWHEFQEILHREQPYTVLYELTYSVGAANRIRGVSVDVRSFLVSIEDWWIAPSDRRYSAS